MLFNEDVLTYLSFFADFLRNIEFHVTGVDSQV